MRFKGTFVLLILFLGLGSYVYFTEIRGREARQQAEEAKKKVFQVEQKDITEISLVYPDRTITGVKKGEKKWEMTSPSGIEADPDEWDLLASYVPKIERDQTVMDNAPDLAEFGLNEPAIKLIAKTSGGQTLEVLFGNENPRKTLNYAKLSNSNEVFLTPNSWATSFTKTVSDLRNKRVLEFEVDDVDMVTLSGGGRQVEFQKSGEDWQVKKPLDTKADKNEISAFLSSIRFARASFPDPVPAAQVTGLSRAAVRITLHDAKAKADRVLLVGNTAEADKYYARDTSRDAVFTIDKDIPEKARRPIFDWRDKTVVQVDRDRIEEIDIQRGDETSSIRKDGSDWKLADGRKVQADKVSGMLSTLEFEKAKDIIDSPRTLSFYGLDKPRIDVAFKQGSTEMERFAFGGESKDSEGVYIKTSDDPAVRVVSKELFDKFDVKADDLVEVPPKSDDKPKS